MSLLGLHYTYRSPFGIRGVESDSWFLGLNVRAGLLRGSAPPEVRAPFFKQGSSTV